jgi:citrate lyase beta subunit
LSKNKSVQISQYLSLVRYKALPTIIKKLEKKKIGVILDFEDSSKDIFNARNTIFLKSECRKGFEFLNKKKIKNSNIFLRINGLRSKFVSDDIECLKKNINRGFKINSIFVPKIQNYNDLSIFYKKLNLKKYKIKLVAMIETPKGYQNLENILKSDKKGIIYGVHYGHYDFCLSNRTWPVPEPYHEEYWKVILDISNKCSIFKKKFIQTPFPIINNPRMFHQSIAFLKKKVENSDLMMTTVNFDERYFIKKINFTDILKIRKISFDKKYCILFAKKIMREYETSKSAKKSFSLSNKRFIPPHQYLLAKYFLKKNIT